MPPCWTLFDAFESLIGDPVLLNTSFKIQEPIVCPPTEAISASKNSEVDALIMGSGWIRPRA